MLNTIPDRQELIGLIGGKAYENLDRLRERIDSAYDVPAEWNDGGKCRRPSQAACQPQEAVAMRREMTGAETLVEDRMR